MIIRTINHLEISSICNESCRYCPAKDTHLHRKTGFMDMETFKATMEWLKYFVRKGTQTELNLYGIGEPTLNPLLPEFIIIARAILPMRFAIHINTNGAWIDTTTTDITDKELAYIQTLKDAGISHIDVTAHNHYKTAKAIKVLKLVGIPGAVSFDPVLHPNNWAGQVDWFAPDYDAGPCPWIHKGQAFILHNGDITRCCIDAFGRGILGNVNDGIKEINTTPFELCSQCHHRV